MYHKISDTPERKAHPYYWTATSPAIFADHMRFLKEQNYTTISLQDALSRIESKSSIPSREVVVTFDDGYEDFYIHAFPTLSMNGFTATMFLPTSFIGKTSKRFNDADCLTWSEVRELSRAGIEFGSHTVTHPQLRTLKPQAIRNEVRGSKATIEEELGSSVKSFAYPYALPEADKEFKRRMRDILQEEGYDHGVSTAIGSLDRNGDRFFMKRLPVNSADDRRLFRAKLAGGYGWLHSCQYAWKAMGGLIQRRSPTSKVLFPLSE